MDGVGRGVLRGVGLAGQASSGEVMAGAVDPLAAIVPVYAKRPCPCFVDYRGPLPDPPRMKWPRDKTKLDQDECYPLLIAIQIPVPRSKSSQSSIPKLSRKLVLDASRSEWFDIPLISQGMMRSFTSRKRCAGDA